MRGAEQPHSVNEDFVSQALAELSQGSLQPVQNTLAPSPCSHLKATFVPVDEDNQVRRPQQHVIAVQVEVMGPVPMTATNGGPNRCPGSAGTFAGDPLGKAACVDNPLDDDPGPVASSTLAIIGGNRFRHRQALAVHGSQQLIFTKTAHSLLALPKERIGADACHPATPPISTQNALAELAANKPGGAAPALPANRGGFGAITAWIEKCS